MLKAINTVLTQMPEQQLQIVLLLTDGFISHEDDINRTIRKNNHPQRRFVTLGIGDYVNRHLIDSVGKNGNGYGQVVSLQDKASDVCAKLITSLSAPALQQVQIDWGDAPVHPNTPKRLNDIFRRYSS